MIPGLVHKMHISRNNLSSVVGLKIGKPKYTCFYRRLSTIMFDKKKYLYFPIKTIFLYFIVMRRR